MYEKHFGFHRQAFQSADACRAFFVSESIREILPQLLHALRSDLGIAVLTGMPGSGKTSLLRHIQQQLATEGRVIVCSAANLGTSADLIGTLLQASRMTGGTETPTKLVAIECAVQGSRASALNHMKRTAELWGPVLLLIDDVQLMPLPVLNELRACTEEEWNGRNLVRCLVSAPISFEDQLARQEYADFARRIRCHAFLQPLKSSESILFLKDQIELAGGHLSNVFTTPALESITAAAGGNPRCLGLLADETLVVAAMVGDKIVSEKSVRTALSRLQHLQYNWNTSPHMDVVEEIQLDFEPTNIESKPAEIEKPTSSISSVISSTSTPAAPRFQAPTQATIAPGVIEFGGPANSATRTISETSSVIATPPVPIQHTSTIEDNSDYIDVSESVALPEHVHQGDHTEPLEVAQATAAAPSANFDDNPDSVINQTAPRNTTFEFDFPNSRMEPEHSAIVRKPSDATPGFEVGRRFVSESAQESISIEDVEDCHILELLNLDAGLDFAGTTSPSMKPPSVSKSADVAEAKIVWFDGNADAIETQEPVATNSANMTLADDSTSPWAVETPEQTSANATQPAVEMRNDRSEPESNNLATRGKFFDPARTKLSNRLPVFDRYTWLSLGREVPAGRSSVVSISATRQLIQADYAMLPFKPLATVSSSSATLQRVTSIDQIPINMTTDATLSEEIARNSLNAQSGTYLPNSAEEWIRANISTTLQPANVQSVATSPGATDSFDSNCAAETSHDETYSEDSQTVSNCDATEDSAKTNPQSISGLRIWRDGMLIFPNAEPTADFNAPDSHASSHASNIVEHHAIETSNETKLTQSVSAEESILQRNVLQLGEGGFFTLPEPTPQHADDLSSLKISKDEDVYTFVEAINNMRADVRSFQNTGSVLAEDSDSASQSPQSADSVNQSDNVVSRAKRRLGDRTNTAGNKTVALQMSQEVRGHQKTLAEVEPVSSPDGTLNTESAPKFGSLFTRLRETRNRTADQAPGDA